MSIADDLIAAHAPWLTDDLETYLTTVGQMFAEVELYAFDTADADGWTSLLDPDRCPAAALPYLAQFMGERLPVGLETTNEALAREWIKDAPNQRRGTVMSIVRAAQRTLTGQRMVSIDERTPDEDHLLVTTYTSETPNSAAVLADLRTVVPADIVLTYQVLGGQAWSAANTTYASWNALRTGNTDWGQLASTQSGVTVWTRPQP